MLVKLGLPNSFSSSSALLFGTVDKSFPRFGISSINVLLGYSFLKTARKEFQLYGAAKANMRSF